jgi:hypothetical protein
MKRSLLSLAIAISLLTGCAMSGRIMSSVGDGLSSIDTPLTKGVGGFYTRTGNRLQGKTAEGLPAEEKKE